MALRYVLAVTRVPAHGCPTIDLDVHPIPARPGEPAHEHHDVRFLLVARPDQRLERSHESKDLRWFPRSELTSWIDEESLLRMHRKASPWLEALS